MQGAIAAPMLSKGVLANGLLPGRGGNIDRNGAGDNWATFELSENGIPAHVVLPTKPGDRPPNDDTGFLGDAVERYLKTGKHYGAFDSDEAGAAFMSNSEGPAMQGAIAVNEILGGGRYKRRPDGAYIDTKTGAVYPNEESLPKDAREAPMGALETQPRKPPLTARRGPIDTDRYTPRSGGGFSDAQSGYVYPNEDTVPGMPPTPEILTREGGAIPPAPPDAQPQPQSGGIDTGPAVPSMPMPKPQGAIAAEPNTWLGNIMSGKGLLAKSAPSQPGSAADVIERMASGQGIFGKRPQAGAIAAPQSNPMMPPTPAVTQNMGALPQPVSMTAPQGGGADTGPAVPSMPMPKQGALPDPSADLSPERLALLQSSFAQPKTPVATAPTMPPGIGGQAPQGQQPPAADAMGALAPPVDRQLVDAAKMTDHNPAGAIDVSGAIDKGGDAAMAGLQPETHEGDFLQQLAGKVGIGDGTSTESGAESNSRNMGLLRAGLAMMTSAGKPGATALGSLGEGGLYALDASEKEKDRDESKAWRKTVFDADQTNKKSVLNLDMMKWLTGEKHQERQDAETARGNDIRAVTANATADWRKSQTDNAGRGLDIQQQNANAATARNALTAAQQKITMERNGVDALNMKDQRAQQEFSTRSRAAATELDPERADQLRKKAEFDAAWTNWDSKLGLKVGNDELAKYQQALSEATAKGDDVKAKQAQDGIAKITGHFFRDVKTPPK